MERKRRTHEGPLQFLQNLLHPSVVQAYTVKQHDVCFLFFFLTFKIVQHNL